MQIFLTFSRLIHQYTRSKHGVCVVLSWHETFSCSQIITSFLSLATTTFPHFHRVSHQFYPSVVATTQHIIITIFPLFLKHLLTDHWTVLSKLHSLSPTHFSISIQDQLPFHSSSKLLSLFMNLSNNLFHSFHLLHLSFPLILSHTTSLLNTTIRCCLAMPSPVTTLPASISLR